MAFYLFALKHARIICDYEKLRPSMAQSCGHIYVDECEENGNINMRYLIILWKIDANNNNANIKRSEIINDKQICFGDTRNRSMHIVVRNN